MIEIPRQEFAGPLFAGVFGNRERVRQGGFISQNRFFRSTQVVIER